MTYKILAVALLVIGAALIATTGESILVRFLSAVIFVALAAKLFTLAHTKKVS